MGLAGTDHDCDDLIARFGFCTRCAAVTGQAPRDQGQLALGQVACAIGGEAISPTDPKVYRLQAGWARNRGATGGTHALALRRDLDRWACLDHVEDVKAGRLNQPALPEIPF